MGRKDTGVPDLTRRTGGDYVTLWLGATQRETGTAPGCVLRSLTKWRDRFLLFLSELPSNFFSFFHKVCLLFSSKSNFLGSSEGYTRVVLTEPPFVRDDRCLVVLTVFHLVSPLGKVPESGLCSRSGNRVKKRSTVRRFGIRLIVRTGVVAGGGVEVTLQGPGPVTVGS